MSREGKGEEVSRRNRTTWKCCSFSSAEQGDNPWGPQPVVRPMNAPQPGWVCRRVPLRTARACCRRADGAGQGAARGAWGRLCPAPWGWWSCPQQHWQCRCPHPCQHPRWHPSWHPPRRQATPGGPRQSHLLVLHVPPCPHLLLSSSGQLPDPVAVCPALPSHGAVPSPQPQPPPDPWGQSMTAPALPLLQHRRHPWGAPALTRGRCQHRRHAPDLGFLGLLALPRA